MQRTGRPSRSCSLFLCKRGNPELMVSVVIGIHHTTFLVTMITNEWTAKCRVRSFCTWIWNKSLEWKVQLLLIMTGRSMRDSDESTLMITPLFCVRPCFMKWRCLQMYGEEMIWDRAGGARKKRYSNKINDPIDSIGLYSKLLFYLFAPARAPPKIVPVTQFRESNAVPLRVNEAHNKW